MKILSLIWRGIDALSSLQKECTAAAAMAIDETNCAVVSTFFQALDPVMILSGTTRVSPGRMTALNTLPFHNPDPPPWPTTAPLARMT